MGVGYVEFALRKYRHLAHSARFKGAFGRRGVEKRILVIDDDETVRRLVTQLLQRDEYRFTEAGSGEQGVQFAGENPPDLILCDCTMPEMSGLEVLAAIRDADATSSIPFMFLTATDDQGTRDRAAELGVTAFMSKPIQVRELRARVAHLLLGEVPPPDLLE